MMFYGECNISTFTFQNLHLIAHEANFDDLLHAEKNINVYMYITYNGETTSLVLVKGHANIGLVQKIKKNLIKAAGINFSNFGIDEECIRLNTSSSVSLTFEVRNIQVII